MSAVLVAAFALSVVHTIYAWVAGIEDPTFTVDTPLAWGFYAVAFGMAALARRIEQWAQLTVIAYLATVLGIAFSIVGYFLLPNVLPFFHADPSVVEQGLIFARIRYIGIS